MKINELLMESVPVVPRGNAQDFSKDEYTKFNKLISAHGMHTVRARHGNGALRLRVDGIEDRDKRNFPALKKALTAAYPGWNLKIDKDYGWVDLRDPSRGKIPKGEPLSVFRRLVKPKIAEVLGVEVGGLMDIWPGGTAKTQKIWQAVTDLKSKELSKFSQEGESEDGDYEWEVSIVEANGMKFADIILQEGGPATSAYVIKKTDLDKLGK